MAKTAKKKPAERRRPLEATADDARLLRILHRLPVEQQMLLRKIIAETARVYGLGQRLNTARARRA